MKPFPISVDGAALDDLRRRLESARWPTELPGGKWHYGTEQAFLRSVVERWTGEYDWWRTESELNALGSHLTNAAGQQVHLLHVPSADPAAIPLALIHGWPGSIIEFLDALPLLRERYHVVVVSMPGYGFSGPTSERGVDVAKVAAAVDDVMGQLGYRRYLAQGGDWGAIVSRYLGEHYARSAVAIHVNFLLAPLEAEGPDMMDGVTEEEIAALVGAGERMGDGTGYLEIQSTRPHSLGYGLEDSPLGLAGWIVEKFHAWCDTADGGIPVGIDRLIDNLMLYWLTGTATSAARLYCESARAGTAPLSTAARRALRGVGAARTLRRRRERLRRRAARPRGLLTIGQGRPRRVEPAHSVGAGAGRCGG